MEVIVVLCRAETSLNVGAVCRVMANCELMKLRIVADPNIYNEKEVLTLALHARNLWDHAEFYPATVDGLRQATSDCNAIFATTRREGAKRKHSGLSPDIFVKLCSQEHYERIALVFGNERTGLTDEEIAICSHSINIPSAPAYPSYNLSHAVLVLAYTLFAHKNLLQDDILLDASLKNKLVQNASIQESSPLIKWKDKNLIKRKTITYAQSCITAREIVSKLKHMGLYKKGGEKDCEQFLSQMLTRSRLSEEEAEYFANIFNKLLHKNKKRDNK